MIHALEGEVGFALMRFEPVFKQFVSSSTWISARPWIKRNKNPLMMDKVRQDLQELKLYDEAASSSRTACLKASN